MSIHEAHKSHRNTWLRAAVLGANDGIVSTASLIIGVAAAAVTKEYILISGPGRPGCRCHVNGCRGIYLGQLPG